MSLGYQNNVEHALISKSRGRVVIPEPINFEDGNGIIYERDSDSKGFLKSKSNSLEFYEKGFEFLNGQFAVKGIAEDVVLQKRVKDELRIDERWRTVSETYLDMAELETDEERADSGGVAKTKSTEGGLYKLIKSNYRTKYDVAATESSDGVRIKDEEGNNIGNLKTVTVTPPQREILLRSELTVEDGTLIRAIVSGGDNLNARTIPFFAEINSDADHITSAITDQLSAASGNYANLSSDKQGNPFYQLADADTTLTLNGRVEIRITTGNIGTLTLDLVRYNGIDYNYVEKINLDSVNPFIIGNVAFFDFKDYHIAVEKGDSLAIGILSNTQDGIAYETYNTKLEVTEDSKFRITSLRAVTPLEMGNRLVLLATGKKDSFRSSLLEEGGKHEAKLLTQGFWVRNFPDIVKKDTDEERRIQFKNSLEDLLKHFDALEPIAWWVEYEGNREVMRMESLKYTQQNFNTIKYGRFFTDTTGKRRIVHVKASKIKRKVLKDNFYGSIELGSEKGGDGYEEVFGLQSVCGRAEWSTINNTSESKYIKLSPYRLGDIDVELARRRQYSDFPDTDTQYDSDIMCLDCMKSGNNYRLKQWTDVYEEKPKNIYRVDSAYNLEFTPARLLLNHGFEINVGLYHYPNEFISFASSNCNSSFISKKTGEIELVEDGNISHSRLEKPRIRPRSVDLVFKVEQELEDLITGYTNGVPNWFGIVSVDTGESIESMRLIKCDTNKEGKHKLVEAI